MAKVPWINYKNPNMDHIAELLEPSIRSNHMSNGGPLVGRLESLLTSILELDNLEDSEYVVILACNGTAALHALIAGIDKHNDAKYRYASQAFAFPSTAQGNLTGVKIVDVDSDLGLDLSEVNPEEVDGIIVTNLFGFTSNLEKYLDWTDQNHKLLIFDNATAPLTKYHGKSLVSYGEGSIVSLHHTKPLGFGEGGAIVCKKKYESDIRQILNFGFGVENGMVVWDSRGSNYKMSDVAAAFLYDHISRNWEKIRSIHSQLYSYFQERVQFEGLDVEIFPNFSDSNPIVSCIPILFPHQVTGNMLHIVELHNITARKYYTPLVSLPRSQDFYDRILCFPCHIDMNESTIDLFIELIKKLS